MRAEVMLATLSVVFLASPNPVRAQSTACASAPLAARDVCFVAHDVFRYVSPQLGIGLTGGNLILGQGGTLAGLGRFALGVRANVIGGNFPSIEAPSTTGESFRTPSNPYPTTNQKFGLPAAELAIGLFRGVGVGGVTVGSFDLLAGAVYMPELDIALGSGNFSVAVGSGFAPAFGGRIGVLLESLYLPGISVGYMQRRLPTLQLAASIADDSLRVNDMTLVASSLRLTAGKSFAAVRVAAGVGTDAYDNSAMIEAIVNAGTRAAAAPDRAEFTMTRLNYFANAALNLPVVKLIAEAGMVSGGDAITSNVFDVDAAVARIYGSIGFQISR